MWQPKQVERALFRWRKWRCSLIHQWVSETELHELSLDDLRLRVKGELQKLGLEGPNMALYWICSVVSDCNLDYEMSFEKIIIPPWMVSLVGDSRLEARVYPSFLIMSERDRDFLSPMCMILPPDHELYPVIETLRGRPRKLQKLGGLPKYPDRIAVRCAALKQSGKTYVEIARLLGLDVTNGEEHELSERSDITRHLVNRGRRLMSEHIGLIWSMH